MLPTFGLWGLGAAHASGQLITGLSKVNPGADKIHSNLAIDSSSTKLLDVFNWARDQALAYAFDSGDPVGPWYEAVEPGREGFCIRDTCHQSLGAHALGLARFNLNMLRRFAENVSESKDWCSYWEIDRYNRPAPVDYKNDAEFWYNLPANFDLLDCCFRMYVWSGDLAYVEDPVFLNLYDRTVNNYVERWGLDIDQAMTRPRLLNARGIFDESKKFPRNRGIPGYNEGDHGYVLGLDVLATQHAAYLAYAHIQQVRRNGELADRFLKKSAAVEDLLHEKWWSSPGQCFYQRLNQDHQLEDCRTRPEDARQALNWRPDVASDAESFAHQAQDQDAAVGRMLDLSHARLEYPEVSYARVGDLVNRLIGVSLQFSSPLLSDVEGNWVEVTVNTLSGLGTGIEWAEVRNLPIRNCEVTVRHEGVRQTTFTNQSGPALIWRSAFSGAHPTLLVNGRKEDAQVVKDKQGRTFSCLRVTAGAGGTISVEIPK